ncbi:MAG: efflux RND transporter permease subunit [Sphingobacterium sp.]|nr:efflux RND transporter permease subunit [Sphingobacterium sp.]
MESFRTTIISLLAIPLSLLRNCTGIEIAWHDNQYNEPRGMAIAIGSLVDDAIIDVENVYKRLRQNRLEPKNERQIIHSLWCYEASKEIRASIFNATIIIIVGIPSSVFSFWNGRTAC